MLQALGANVEYVVTEGEGHSVPEDIPPRAIQYIYENLPNSGVEAGAEPQEGYFDFMTDVEQGIFSAFDQTPILEESLAEFESLPGGYGDVEHNIL
jgi:hypothetical protein